MGRLITGAGYTGTIGGTITVYGTPERQTITVADVAGTVTFDPSFNKGGDTIVLAKSAASYTIAQSGSTVILSDGDSRIVIPVGTVANTVQFSDGDRTLLFSGGVKIGSQAVTTTAATITATGTTKSTLAADAATQAARLVLSEESASVGGNVMVYGTAGVESVSVFGKGKITFDPSFNKGGDEIQFGDAVAAYSAQRLGSSVSISDAQLSASIPVGTVGTTLNFAGDTQVLKFQSGVFQLGDTTITENKSQITDKFSQVRTNYLKIGYYYDYGNDFLSDAEFRKFFDKAKSAGFGGVNFELSVGVDETGKLLPSLGYERLYRLIQLASDDGLKVALKYNWIIGNDNANYIDNRIVFGSGATTANLIKSVSEFYDSIADKLNSLPIAVVDLYQANTGRVFSENRTEWSNLFRSLTDKLTPLTTVNMNYVLSDQYPQDNIVDLAYVYQSLDLATYWLRWDARTTEDDPNTINDNILAILKRAPNVVDTLYKVSADIKKPIIFTVNAFAVEHALDGGWDPVQSDLDQKPVPVFGDRMLEAYKTSLLVLENYFGSQTASYWVGNLEPWELKNYDGQIYDNWKYIDLISYPNDVFSFLAGFNSGRVIDNTLIFYGSKEIRGGAGNDRIIIPEYQYSMSFKIAQWYDKNNLGSQNIFVSANGVTKEYSLKNDVVDTWKQITGSIVSNVPITEFSVALPEKNGFIEIMALSYSNSVASGSVNLRDGVKTKDIKFDWSKPEWLLPGDEIKYSLKSTVDGVNPKIYGGEGIDEVVLPRFKFGNSYLELFDVETVSDFSGKKIFDALPHTKVIFLQGGATYDVNFFQADALLSKGSNLNFSLSNGHIMVANPNSFLGSDYVDAVLVENGVRWETRLIFMFSEPVSNAITFG